MNMATVQSAQIESLCMKLRVLSVETRLRMLSLLAERNLCVGALACQLGVTQGAVSQHFKILREAGLVIAERDGYYVHYRVDEQAVADLQEELDRGLEQIRRGRTSEEPGSETPDVQCRRRKESVCARRKSKTVAGRGTT